MAEILFINRVYPPDAGATGQLLAELAEHLAARGHRVRVLAAMDTQSKAQALDVAEARPAAAPEPGPGKVLVMRYWSPGGRKSLGAKALNYAIQYPLLAWKLGREPRVDVMVSLTDPPLQFALVSLFRAKARRGLIHWAQDVYPEVAEELGALPRAGLAARVLRALARRALRRHQAVVAVGRCMEARLREKVEGKTALEVIPNWAPLPAPASGEEAEIREWRRNMGAGDKLVVMYSGNFGRAHPFEALVEAARRLAERQAPVHFALVGEGPRLAWTKQALAGLPNVSFHPFQPWEKLRVSLAAADVHLACMEDHLSGLVVPSKVYGALGVGRPVLFLGPATSEAARFILEKGCGWVLEKPDGDRLRERLERLAASPEECAAFRRAAEGAAPLVARAARLEEWTRVIERVASEDDNVNLS